MALEKVVLPVYSKTEEILNSVSHGIGVLLGIAFLIIGIQKSTLGNNLAASIVFGISSIVLYTCSMLYHSLKAGTAKKAMRLIDHSAIFIMITGSATAINLMSVYPYNKVFFCFGCSYEYSSEYTRNCIDLYRSGKIYEGADETLYYCRRSCRRYGISHI